MSDEESLNRDREQAVSMEHQDERLKCLLPQAIPPLAPVPLTAAGNMQIRATDSTVASTPSPVEIRVGKVNIGLGGRAIVGTVTHAAAGRGLTKTTIIPMEPNIQEPFGLRPTPRCRAKQPDSLPRIQSRTQYVKRRSQRVLPARVLHSRAIEKRKVVMSLLRRQ